MPEIVIKTLPATERGKYSELRVVERYHYGLYYCLEEKYGPYTPRTLVFLRKGEHFLNFGRFELFQEETLRQQQPHQVSVECVCGLGELEIYMNIISEIATDVWSFKKHCRHDISMYLFSFESERDAVLFKLRT